MKLPYMIETRLEAEWCLTHLIQTINDLIDQYEFISVVDVHDIVSTWCTCEVSRGLRYIDNCYGWRKGEFSAEIRCIRSWGHRDYCFEVSEPRLYKIDG